MKCSICKKKFTDGDIVYLFTGNIQIYGHTNEFYKVIMKAGEGLGKEIRSAPFGFYLSENIYIPTDLPQIEQKKIYEKLENGEKVGVNIGAQYATELFKKYHPKPFPTGSLN